MRATMTQTPSVAATPAPHAAMGTSAARSEPTRARVRSPPTASASSAGGSSTRLADFVTAARPTTRPSASASRVLTPRRTIRAPSHRAIVDSPITSESGMTAPARKPSIGASATHPAAAVWSTRLRAKTSPQRSHVPRTVSRNARTEVIRIAQCRVKNPPPASL